MIQIIKKQKQELIVGLADLYIQKERIDKQIEAQRVAIKQCSALINAIVDEKTEGPEITD